MTGRRVIGCITAVFMLHLSLVASDTTCATHEAGAHAATTTMAGMPMPVAARADGATPHRTGPDARDHHRHPCDTPVRPNCCEALASCNSAFDASGSSSSPVAFGQAPVSNSVKDFAASEVTAPDTPPPKA